MRITQFCIRALCLSAAMTFFAVPTARAGYIINISQVGSDVVMSGSGSIDTVDLTLLVSNFNEGPLVGASSGQALVGTAGSASSAEIFSGLTGPTSFGSGALDPASSGSGPIVGVGGFAGRVVVPQGYSGNTLASSTDTYNSQSYATLGLTPGTYTWTWGTSPDADTFTVNIAPAPEPASLSLFALAGIPLLRRRRRAATNH